MQLELTILFVYIYMGYAIGTLFNFQDNKIRGFYLSLALFIPGIIFILGLKQAVSSLRKSYANPPNPLTPIIVSVKYYPAVIVVFSEFMAHDPRRTTKDIFYYTNKCIEEICKKYEDMKKENRHHFSYDEKKSRE